MKDDHNIYGITMSVNGRSFIFFFFDTPKHTVICIETYNYKQLLLHGSQYKASYNKKSFTGS